MACPNMSVVPRCSEAWPPTALGLLLPGAGLGLFHICGAGSRSSLQLKGSCVLCVSSEVLGIGERANWG